MNKQLKLNDAARRLVRMLGNELLRLGEEQGVMVWSGHFQLSAVDPDKIWFSYHPSNYYLDDPTTAKHDDEKTVELHESTVQRLQAEAR